MTVCCCYSIFKMVCNLCISSCFVHILQRKALDEKIKLKEEQEKFKVCTVANVLMLLLFEIVI